MYAEGQLYTSNCITSCRTLEHPRILVSVGDLATNPLRILKVVKVSHLTGRSVDITLQEEHVGWKYSCKHCWKMQSANICFKSPSSGRNLRSNSPPCTAKGLHSFSHVDVKTFGTRSQGLSSTTPTQQSCRISRHVCSLLYGH